MSFRKKARPVVSVSAVARARASKGTASDQSQKNKVDGVPVGDGSTSGPCELSNNRPSVDAEKEVPLESKTSEDLNDKSINKNEALSSLPSTPIAIGKRFKRTKPMPNLLAKRSATSQQSVFSECEKLQSKTDEIQPDASEASTEREVNGVPPCFGELKGDSSSLAADKVVEHVGVRGQGFASSTPKPGAQCEIKNLAESPSNLVHSKVEKTDILADYSKAEENPMGFLVTESKISYGSCDSFDDKTQGEKNNDSGTMPHKDKNDINDAKGIDNKVCSASNRFKKQRPQPNFRSQRPNNVKKVDVLKENAASERSNESDTGSIASSQSKLLDTNNENCKIKDSKNGFVLAKENDLLLDEKCTTQSDGSGKLEILQGQPESELPSDIFGSSKSNESLMEVRSNRTDNEDISVSKAKGSIGKGSKVSKRVKFKPNITPKGVRNTSKTVNQEKQNCPDDQKGKNVSPTDNKIENELEPSQVKKIDTCISTGKTDSPIAEKTAGKHVRFDQDIVTESTLPNVSNGGETPAMSEKKDSPNIARQNSGSKYSASYSDTEDGSQSEGEGIHHHGKRKFAPCLGPGVRQRRRLSSMNLSEDESHLVAKISSEFSKSSDLSYRVKERGGSSEANNEDGLLEESGKKKQKRKRIVIKEPKEKMTMFDYIYYNPKKSEQEEAEDETERKEKKRQSRELTRPEESEVVVGSINGESADLCNDSSIVTIDDNLSETGDDSIIAPQIKIGEDGQIIIDEASLLLKTTRSKVSLENSEIVYTDTFNPYQRRQEPTKKKRWPVEETLKFYRILSRIGTDFSFMVQFFPECTRRNLKKKFKTEEKYNGDLIDRALKNMLPLDQALIEELNSTNADKQQIPKENSALTEKSNNKKPETKKRTSGKNRGKGSRPTTSISQEKKIVEEEIMTMEVAENVTI